MATDQHTCYTARCDECRNDYENDDQMIVHFDSAEAAIDGAVGDGWQHLSDGRLLCGRCVSRAEARGEIEEDAEGTFRLVPATC